MITESIVKEKLNPKSKYESELADWIKLEKAAIE